MLGPVGGALADRLPRKRLLLTTTTIQTILATTLTVLVATGDPGPGIVTLIVFAAGCAQAIGFPAYQAVLPDLVPAGGPRRRGRALVRAVEPRSRRSDPRSPGS